MICVYLTLLLLSFSSSTHFSLPKMSTKIINLGLRPGQQAEIFREDLVSSLNCDKRRGHTYFSHMRNMSGGIICTIGRSYRRIYTDYMQICDRFKLKQKNNARFIVLVSILVFNAAHTLRNFRTMLCNLKGHSISI